MASYEGQESEFSLESLLILADQSPSASATLGTRRRRVHVELYPIGTPVPDGYRYFVDNSAVMRSVLAIGLPRSIPPPEEQLLSTVATKDVPSLDDLIEAAEAMVAEYPRVTEDHPPTLGGQYALDEPEVKATCRLSNSKLRSLTKRYYYTEADLLHPLDDMEAFPFIPICRISEEGTFQKVYSPPIIQQDIVVDPLVELERPIVPSPLADWSSATLQLPVVDSDDSWMEHNVLLHPVAEVHAPIRNRRYHHAPRGQDGITAVPVYRAEFRG